MSEYGHYDEPELDEVCEWAEALVHARFERNAAIMRASKTGFSLRDIAGAAGLSHSAIAKIVRR